MRAVLLKTVIEKIKIKMIFLYCIKKKKSKASISYHKMNIVQTIFRIAKYNRQKIDRLSTQNLSELIIATIKRMKNNAKNTT